MGCSDETSYTFENGFPTYGEPNSPIMDIEENILPERIASLYCYPNPFNAQTTISFSLERETHAKISIYDIHQAIILLSGMPAICHRGYILPGLKLMNRTSLKSWCC